jgi:hypothetical protein
MGVQEEEQKEKEKKAVEILCTAIHPVTMWQGGGAPWYYGHFTRQTTHIYSTVLVELRAGPLWR